MSRRLRLLPPASPAVRVSVSERVRKLAVAHMEAAIKGGYTRDERRCLFNTIMGKCRARILNDGTVRLIAIGEFDPSQPGEPPTRSLTPPFRGPGGDAA